VLTLAIDTATAQVGVAFGRDGRVLGEVRIDGGRRHAEELAPAIRYLSGETGVALDQLAFVAVGVGPGLYTGLRVGVTTARTLAQVLEIPIVGIPSLDLVAYPWRAAHREVVALIDARRQEVFAARYLPVPGGMQRVGEYVVCAPDAIAAEIAAAGSDVLVAGDGALAHPEVFAGVEHVELVGAPGAAPSPVALVELATGRYEREEFSRPDELVPLYLRRSDAEIAWDHR
jgi:tRNA threonylcarbamoyladenosine biosynthesis protein TsaB